MTTALGAYDGFPESTTVAAAQEGDEEAFRRLTEQHVRELHLHCYRMLGSLHDADDGDAIAEITGFADPTLFPFFRLPDRLEK